ncbi:hypothetical protein ERO13_D04G178200v2 [Gossypium hirsutum]|uniref:Transmembrane protein n=2 Tax=Gossypium TaxID=3633 RepID=A0A1U8IRM3_GOSHI|nr:uncharacterized protein LOC107898030 [Gossypium hirsutum]KAG4153353.1 hypothetical protein ERO13_D04G178200v2 [Gossypium hirsutum]TYI88422.1 hypothetical protein E1A91_D04G208400v1 [Gossypium mustelinum]
METWMEFEIKNHTHTLNQKLNFFNTLKQALMIPYKSPNIIVLCFLVSIPLCFTLFFHEMMLQQTIIAAMDMLREPNAKTMANSFFYKLIQLALLRLLPLHLSELCVAVVTIDSVSRKEKSEMVRRLVDKERWRGILVTSMYVQFVSNGFLLGSTWLMMNYYVIVRSFCYNVFTAAFLRICGVGLVVKFLEWMVMWNMSIVISTSEEVHGVDALGLSAYLCRGKERRGFWLTFVFFVSRIGLRFVCFNNGSYGKRWWMILGVSLICLGKVIKWVVCVMYFYHCKEGRLERVDVEVGELVINCKSET